MKTLIASLLFASVAACSHHDAEPASPAMMGSNTEAATATDPDIDPTLPSWAPPSCRAYHTAVVKLAGCTEVAQAIRDKASAKYDADLKAWHDMKNAQQSDLDQVKASCGDQASSVNAQLTASCAAAPTKS